MKRWMLWLCLLTIADPIFATTANALTYTAEPEGTAVLTLVELVVRDQATQATSALDVAGPLSFSDDGDFRVDVAVIGTLVPVYDGNDLQVNFTDITASGLFEGTSFGVEIALNDLGMIWESVNSDPLFRLSVLDTIDDPQSGGDLALTVSARGSLITVLGTMPFDAFTRTTRTLDTLNNDFELQGSSILMTTGAQRVFEVYLGAQGDLVYTLRTSWAFPHKIIGADGFDESARFTPAPEPSIGLLLSTGALGLVGLAAMRGRD